MELGLRDSSSLVLGTRTPGARGAGLGGHFCHMHSAGKAVCREPCGWQYGSREEATPQSWQIKTGAAGAASSSPPFSHAPRACEIPLHWVLESEDWGCPENGSLS